MSIRVGSHKLLSTADFEISSTSSKLQSVDYLSFSCSSEYPVGITIYSNTSDTSTYPTGKITLMEFDFIGHKILTKADFPTGDLSASIFGDDATYKKLQINRNAGGQAGSSDVLLHYTVSDASVSGDYSTEEIQDIVGAMVDGGTETNISVTYDDTNGRLDFVSADTNTQLPLIDSDTMSGASPTNVASAESVKAYVDTSISNLLNSPPAALDTLNELAAALGDDANFSTTVTNSIALKAPIADPSFTGTIAIPNIANVETAIAANTAKVDLTVDGAGTIHTNNVPTLNQATTGNAATATALTSGSKSISGNLSIGSHDSSHRIYLARYLAGYPYAHIYCGLNGENVTTGFKIVTKNGSTYSDALVINGSTKNISVYGTVDGRDVAADGTKLDGIEPGATADQTQADINALNVTAASLATGNQTITGNLTVTGWLSVGSSNAVLQHSAKIILSTADCNTLHTNPVQLVPAYGANTVIVPTGGIVRVDRAATQTNSAVNMDFHYNGISPSFSTSSLVHLRRFMWNETGDRVYAITTPGVEISQNLTDDVNSALEVSVSSALTNNCITSVTIFLTYNVFDIS